MGMGFCFLQGVPEHFLLELFIRNDISRAGGHLPGGEVDQLIGEMDLFPGDSRVGQFKGLEQLAEMEDLLRSHDVDDTMGVEFFFLEVCKDKILYGI